MSLPEQFFHFRVLRTRELRELLEDEDKLNHIIRCSEKVHRKQRAVEKMLISNQRLAKLSLSQKPKFRDAKLLLAMKYKELGKLKSLIQAKQEQLAEKYSVHYAQLCLQRKINHAEEDCELLCQRFTEGKMPVVDFLESFISLRKCQHIRMILVKKLQEMIRHREDTGHRVRQIHPVAQHLSVGFPDQIHNPCRLACSLTTAVVLPSCCHPPVFGIHGNFAHYLTHLPFCLNYDEGFRPAERGRGPRRPTAPVRLQPLRVLQKRDQQEPQ